MSQVISTSKLGEVADFVMGQAPPSAETNTQGIGTPFVQVRNFGAAVPRIEEWTTKPLRMAAEGDVLVCIVGATVGKVNLGIEAAITRSIAAVRPKSALLDQKYLYYWMSFNMLQLRSQSSGSAQGVISKDQLATLEIPLPPLDEQRRIVETLDDHLSRIDKALAELAEAHSKLDVFRRSAIEALTAGDETWTTCTLGEVADVNWGDTSLTKAAYREHGFTAFSASGPDGFIERFDFEGDGVVLSAIGAACGKVFFATGKWSAIKNTICITPQGGDVSAKYLYYILNDPNAWQKRGAAQPFIRQADARSRTIRYPEFAKQQELIEKLEGQISEFERMNEHLKIQIEKLALLRRSILNKAFRGELGTK